MPRMRPITYSSSTPRTIEDFAVDWSGAVVEVVAVPEARHGYLQAIACYSNNEDGIFALELMLSADPELARLLGLAHALPTVAREIVPRLLARSAAAAALTAFDPDPAALERRLRERSFEWRDPFALTGELARYLHGYGMYRFFHQDHSADEAMALARAWVHDSAGEVLADIVAFDVWGPWGAWFDEHSCSDRSFLVLDRRRLVGTLLCCSHSD